MAHRISVAILLLASGVAHGQVTKSASKDLGTVAFSISCSAAVQADFNRAVALLHHMTYPQASTAFQQIAAADPECAMAHWGIAMTLFQPLWPTRPGADDIQRGRDAVEKAKSLASATEREQLLIAAAEAFFEPAAADYWQRIQRWEQAMGKAHAALPSDPEIAAFYALALLATAPSDRVSRANADRAAGLLLPVLERNPDHPGAMHYLVHANDTPGREREVPDVIHKYESVAPRNPHALHMPTHVYTRLGDWDAVIEGNLLAAEASLEHRAGDRGQFVWDEFPHAIEYLIYAHLQKGADTEAAAQLKRLQTTAQLQPSFKTAFHLASTAARYALERRAWHEAAALIPREPAGLDWDRFKWPEAVTWFAKGLGAVHTGQVDAARRAVERVADLQADAHGAGEVLFARHIEILRLELAAWLAQAQQQKDSSLALMRRAVELEASTPKHAVTPAPTIPALELLGDLLHAQGRAPDALLTYQQSLEHYPGRFNSLLGAARAARAMGDKSVARTLYTELLGNAADGTRPAAVAEARAFTQP